MKYAATAALAVVLSLVAFAQAPDRNGQVRLRRLLESVAAQEPVRVIVQLNTPFLPEARLAAAGRRAQRDRFARAADQLVTGPAGRHILRSKRFRTIPFAVIETDAAGLRVLASQPEVADIQFDVAERLTLAQSTALIQATSTTAAGYTGAGWGVAVLDTGVDPNHTFLQNRVTYEACFSSSVTGDPDGSGPVPFHTISTTTCPNGLEDQTGAGAAAPCSVTGECGHGTHVAGIAAGSNGVAEGATFSGVAPGAKILAFQVFSRFDSEYECGTGKAPCVLSWASDQLAALERVYQLRATHKIAVVNMSLGGGGYTSQVECDAVNGARKAAIDNLAAAGIATVISAGNSGYGNALGAPACISSAISVGATTGAETIGIASFSNSASFLKLLAPGAPIRSSIPNNAFAAYGGTSMAAPHVAGAWAVLKARRPSASVGSVLAAFRNTGRLIADSRNSLSIPLIQLDAAMLALAPSCSYSITPSSQAVHSGGTSGTIVVSTGAECAWSAQSHSDFITLLANGRTGSGELRFDVAANRSVSPRTGTATIAGQTFTLSQNGTPAVAEPRTTEHSRSDFDGDGFSDLLWQDATDRYLAVWLLEGTTVTRRETLAYRMTDPAWQVAGTGDFNRDGKPDIVWHHRDGGWVHIWYMDGLVRIGQTSLSLGRMPSSGWRIAGIGDFNRDGQPDLAWQHPTEGWLSVWLVDGTTVTNLPFSPNRLLDLPWQIAGVGDFDGDGQSDLLWRHSEAGYMGVWLMDGLNRKEYVPLNPGTVSEREWRIVAITDLSGDGKADLVWQNMNHGWVAAWYMNGTTRTDSRSFAYTAAANWRIAGPR